MKTSESIKQIAMAMLTFHEEVNNIPKSAQNPFFKSKYVPLDKILTGISKPLKTARLSFMQFPKGENELETIIMHESGEWMSECFYMKPVKADPQSYGSVITYQRRYALSSILGLNTDEDDDGNKGSDPGEETPENKKPELLPDTDKWAKAIEFLQGKGTLDNIKQSYVITKENETKLLESAL